MSPEQHPRISELLEAALRVPSGQRSAFLDGACAGEPALRQELHSLLEADAKAEAGGFLGNPLAAQHVKSLLDELAGPGPTGALPEAERDRPEPRLPQVGPYRLLERLGRGGMGVVYRGEHLHTSQRVAVKTLQVVHEKLASSLRREIHALARVRHPGIVRIVDHGLHEGLPWYAMELIEGVTLRQHAASLPGSPLQPRATAAEWWTESLAGSAGVGGSAAGGAGTGAGGRTLPEATLRFILTLVRRLCAPLALLHGEGVVHRDLKPDNVIVKPDGMPVVVDFGVASHFSGQVSRDVLLVERGVSGTAAYMSPEQAWGELVDARADLYALGCILYELLTGRPPFVGSHPVQVLYQHLHAEPTRPSQLVEGVPAEIEELLLRLLAKRPEDRLGYAEDVAAALGRHGASNGLAAEPRPRAYLYRPGLAGRQEALDQIESCLSRLHEGRGGLVLIAGESGVGKTRLALEVERRLEATGARALTGECLPGAVSGPSAAGPLPGEGPLHPLRRTLQLIADRCRERGSQETERLLGPRGKLLAMYEPALGGLAGQEAYADPAELPPEEARLRLFRALAETLSGLAEESPLLLILDDLQWADELTLRFLEHLLRSGQLEHTPLFVLGTYRSEEIKSLSGLLETPGVQSLRLSRLEPSAVASIVGDMLALSPPPEAFSRALARHSEGNPFFIAEYLRSAVERGLLWRDEKGRWQAGARSEARATEQDYESLPLPGSLRELVGQRLQGLPEAALRLVEAAAVVGREASVRVLARMRGLEDGAAQPAAPLLEAVTELLRRQVLEESGPEQLRFVHDKIREFAYERLSPQERRTLHRAAAQGIEALLGREEHHAALGRHWEEAGVPEDARACYLAAARSAAGRHAQEEAERLYRAFLALASPAPETIAARRELARDVLVVRGRAPEAIDELARAIEEARLLADRASEGLCLVELGRVYFLVSRLEEAHRFYTQALEVLRQGGEPKGQAQALHGLGITEDVQGRLDAAEVQYDQALAAARAEGDRAQEAAVLGGLAVLESKRGWFDRACALHEQAIEAARLLGSRNQEAVQLANLAILRRRQGRFRESQELSERSAALFRATGFLRFEGIALMNLTNVLVDLGRLGEARTRSEEALDLLRKVGDSRLEAHALLYRAGLERRGMGDLARALDLLDAAERWPGAAEDPMLRLGCLCERGHIALAQSRSPEETLRRLEAMPEASKPGAGSPEGAALARFERAAAAAAAGRALVHGECPEDLPDGLRRWIAQREPELWNRIAQADLAQAEERSSQGG
jgi:serine/threonine protein kinase/tetratricopeptide (TPR) repeat protein